MNNYSYLEVIYLPIHLSLSSSMSEDLEKKKLPQDVSIADGDPDADPDAEFGGKENRKRLERQLIWKLDLRFSILIVIYILNHVSIFLPAFHWTILSWIFAD